VNKLFYCLAHSIARGAICLIDGPKIPWQPAASFRCGFFLKIILNYFSPLLTNFGLLPFFQVRGRNLTVGVPKVYRSLTVSIP
jgi:hypothetical protein